MLKLRGIHKSVYDYALWSLVRILPTFEVTNSRYPERSGLYRRLQSLHQELPGTGAGWNDCGSKEVPDEFVWKNGQRF